MLCYAYLLWRTMYEMSALPLKGAKLTFLDNPYGKHFKTVCFPVHSPFTPLFLQSQTCSCISYLAWGVAGRAYAHSLHVAPSDGHDSSPSGSWPRFFHSAVAQSPSRPWETWGWCINMCMTHFRASVLCFRALDHLLNLWNQYNNFNLEEEITIF